MISIVFCDGLFFQFLEISVVLKGISQLCLGF